MEGSTITQFFHGKTICVTGSTGFLAKVLLEKILRIQPDIKRIFLLIRATKQKLSGQRLHEETDLFRVFKEKWGNEGLSALLSEKVVPVSGDISSENLGIPDSDLRDQMWREIDIFVNSAATTNFFERYDVALRINTWGAVHALNFAKKCFKAKVLVHISTAYVCGQSAGLIPEKPLSMGETPDGSSYLDIDAETKLVDDKIKELEVGNASVREITLAMKQLGTQRTKQHGWPNTYVFTKAMGEMMLEHFKEKMEVVILRPTIISSTYKEPFPGWIEGVRTLDSLLIAYGKGNLKCYIGNPETIIDLIPCDMVVNSILMATATHAMQSCDHHIYHVGSSLRNPVKYGAIQSFSRSYFAKNPWIGDGRKSVKVGNFMVIHSMAKFHRHIADRYIPFLRVLKVVNVLFCGQFEASYKNFKRKINSFLLLAELYEPYVFFQRIFDDVNTEKLRVIVREGELKNVDFDPECIKWEDYFMNTHVPMVVKYLF